MKSCLIILLLGVSGLNAQAGVNKWVDENNRVHYSDQPAPANVKATPVLIPAVPASGVPAQKTVAEREAELRKAQNAREEEEKKTARQQQDDQAKQKYCEGARIDLKTLENSSRISTYDSKGELVYMDDAARNQRIEEARKGISTHCK